MGRNSYDVILYVNGRRFSKIVIDQHYQLKHHKSITDELIIELVFTLNNRRHKPTSIKPEGFEYYEEDKIKLRNKFYKLIWTINENEDYLGVINCYRRN